MSRPTCHSLRSLIALLLVGCFMLACGASNNLGIPSPGTPLDAPTISEVNADSSGDGEVGNVRNPAGSIAGSASGVVAAEAEDSGPIPALPPSQPIDACTLLSEAEAAAFLGSEIVSVESEPGDRTGNCTFNSQTTTDRPHLKISWTPYFGAGDYRFIREMVQNPRESGTDLGDDYYIRDELSGVQLRLVRGEQYLILEAYGVPEPEGKLKELAGQLLAEIPN